MAWRAESHIGLPRARKTRSAYRDFAQLLMTSRTWSDADSLLVTVTPRLFRGVTQTIPAISGGGAASRFLFLLIKTISFDFDRFSTKLFFRAHVSTFLNSAERESTLLAGMMR